MTRRGDGEAAQALGGARELVPEVARPPPPPAQALLAWVGQGRLIALRDRSWQSSTTYQSLSSRVWRVYHSGAMVDVHYSEPSLAELYDAFCAGRPDFSFYLPLVMSAERVLDAGCGTGELLRLARAAGHTGRLCGLDPAAAMLQVARTRTDIEWILGDLASVEWDRAFDLVVMTGHAFQVLIEDDQLRSALVAIRSALTEHGRLVFETRNPLVRAWEGWTPEHATVIVRDGTVVRMESEVETPIAGDLISFTTTYTSPTWDHPRVSRSTLRFLNAGALSAFLSGAGLAIEEQFGNWDGQPLTDASPEIITVARRARPDR